VTEGTILDCDRIKSLRLENKLSQRALAHKLGVSQGFVRYLEEGDNHEQLNLRMVSRIAEILGADLRDLIRRDSSSADPSPDDIRVEALLADEGVSLAAQEIAAAFEWPILRAHQALRQLKARLTAGGTEVWSGAGRWKLGARRAVLADEERERLARARLPRRGLNRIQAQVLREVAAGTFNKSYYLKSGKLPTNNQELRALAGLLKLGLAALNQDGSPVLRANVERSLHLTTSSDPSR
jgi:transcriptional regulator with XRE-family HTH domain